MMRLQSSLQSMVSDKLSDIDSDIDRIHGDLMAIIKDLKKQDDLDEYKLADLVDELQDVADDLA